MRRPAHGSLDVVRYLASGLATATWLLTATTAPGQFYAYPHRYYGGYGGYGGYGVNYYGDGYGTVAGSTAAGMGALIRSQGAYNQMTANAAVAAEQAKSQALDNKLKAAQTYYQLQRLNQQNRVEQQRAQAARRDTNYVPPKAPTLSASQYDAVSGEIAWMPLLLDDYYQPERGTVQELFLQRAHNPGSVDPQTIFAPALAMRNKLDARHGTIATSDFFAARHFIDAVIETARSGQ